MQLIYFWWDSQPQSTTQLPLPLQFRTQELHLSATSLLHLEYSDEEAQSLSVMFVWALARPERAATVAADAKRNLDNIVYPVLVGELNENVYMSEGKKLLWFGLSFQWHY